MRPTPSLSILGQVAGNRRGPSQDASLTRELQDCPIVLESVQARVAWPEGRVGHLVRLRAKVSKGLV